MIKKIIFTVLILLSFFIGNNVFAAIATERGVSADGTMINPGDTIPDATPAAAGGTATPAAVGGGGGPDDISSKDFEIDTGLFTIGGKSLKGASAKETINNTLGNIIQKLMIALGVIALFVMTVGAGYMVLYHGEDEYLTKGKNIFIGGITALILALSSYYLVNLVGYILYS